MINLRNVQIIFKKEFMQIMRDKSVLFTNFFIPLFGLPLYFIIIIETASYMVAKEKAPLNNETIFKVSAQGVNDSKLHRILESDRKIKLLTPTAALDLKQVQNYKRKYNTYQEAVKSRSSIRYRVKEDKEKLKEEAKKIQVTMNEYLEALDKLQENYSENVDLHIAMFKSEDGPKQVFFFHADDRPVSKAAYKYAKAIFHNYQQELVENYKKERSISEYHLSPFEFKSISLNEAGRKIYKIIGTSLGGMILFLLLIAVYNPTINTTIGERDQNTFKVLLMNPISLSEIFIGKYLNVALQGILTLLPYAIEILIFYAWGSSNFIFDQLPSLTPEKFLAVFFGTISVATLVSSMCFIVCSFAKTRMQAQSLLTLLLFFIAIPTATVGVMDIKLDAMTALFPLINFTMAFENLMTGSPHFPSVAIAIATNFLASLFLIWLSLGSYIVQWKGKSDSIGLSDVLNFKRRKSVQLVPAHAFFAFAISFLGIVYGSFAIFTFKIDFFAYFFLPMLFCLGPAIFVTLYSGLDFTKVIRWEGLNLNFAIRSLFGALLLSYSFNLLFKGLVLPETVRFEFPTLFEGNFVASALGNLLLFAIIPGFTEELLFRGVIYRGLRTDYNISISAVVSSLMFAVIHFSMFRWGHTFLIGIILALVYERRGLFSCILIHCLFNAVGLGFGHSETMQSLILELNPALKLLTFTAGIGLSLLTLVRGKARKNLVREHQDQRAA